MTNLVLKLNKTTSQYGLPADGVLSWSVMFGMYALKVPTIPILVTGAIIHGVVHNIICHCKECPEPIAIQPENPNPVSILPIDDTPVSFLPGRTQSLLISKPRISIQPV